LILNPDSPDQDPFHGILFKNIDRRQGRGTGGSEREFFYNPSVSGGTGPGWVLLPAYRQAGDTLFSGSLEEGPSSAVLYVDFLGVSGPWNLTLEGAATRFLWRAHPDPERMTLPPITEGLQNFQKFS
jgi:hypothetical protein